jgi:hypothetical protein
VTTKTLPFCSPQCRDRQGQLEDPETGLPIGWCDCRRTPPESMVAAVAAANPNALEAAALIVRDVAESNPILSGNDTRDLMIEAGLDVKGIGGAAFVEAHRRGWIEATDKTVQSSDPATRHRLQLWRSRCYRRTA